MRTRVVLVFLALAACQEAPARPPAPPPMYHPPPPMPYVAPPSPPCAEGGYVCSQDRAALLQCRRGQLVVAGTCRGPGGCVEGAGVSCDHSVALPNDPCDEPGRGLACGMERRVLLRCDARGVYVPSETCRNACLSAGGRVLCQ